MTAPAAALLAAILALDRWNLETPVLRFPLPASLREISGLAVTQDGRVFAHDDERGVLYELDLERRSVKKSFTLGKKVRADFEAVTITPDGRLFLVTSDGVLYETREGRDGEKVAFRTTDTGLGAACEIEGLGFEPPDVLLVGCKKHVKKALTVFRWSLSSGRLATPDAIRIPFPEHHPSDLFRDPATGHLLLVCAREQVLLEASPRGELLATRPLDPARHPQAEGLAVLPDGRLLIADEGKHAPGTVTVYAKR